MAWKHAQLVFNGGDAEIQALKGRRVRARSQMIIKSYDGLKADLQGPEFTLKVGQEGFVGPFPSAARPGTVALVFPMAGLLPDTLERLMKQPLFCAHMNTITFRTNFDLDT